MALGTWWRGDPLPVLPALQSFSLQLSTDRAQIAHLADLSLQEVDQRFRAANHLYIAFIATAPVAYGWVATAGGGVREIGLAFTMPPRNSYLWDFQTLPAWRGRGIYSHFLQAIIRQEVDHVERFWILYDPSNTGAGRSIARAGFSFVGELAFTDGHLSGMTLLDASERAYAGARVLNLPALPIDSNR